jgi:hypothetical protein
MYKLDIFFQINKMVFGAVAATVRSSLGATSILVGSLTMGLGIASSFTPKGYQSPPYRPGDGIPSTR